MIALDFDDNNTFKTPAREFDFLLLALASSMITTPLFYVLFIIEYFFHFGLTAFVSVIFIAEILFVILCACSNFQQFREKKLKEKRE